jgi:drug/metabolite transporter (DMT)-like permease
LHPGPGRARLRAAVMVDEAACFVQAPLGLPTVEPLLALGAEPWEPKITLSCEPVAVRIHSATPSDVVTTRSSARQPKQAEVELSAPTLRRDRPARGIALILVSAVFLSCSDVMAKYLASSLPAIEIASIRYFVFLLILLPAIVRKGPARALSSARPALQAFRALGLVGSSILFISSLRSLPIAEATATSFAAPLIITVLSIPILGESVGPRRWAATAVGLIGVLVIVRPGTSAFQLASLLPLLAALSWASAVVVTRRTSAADTALTTLSYSAIIGTLVLSALLPFVWVVPGWQALAFGVLIGCAATAGHWLIVLAFRYGDASVLAPFTYTQLVWSTALGVLVFGTLPDTWTLVGAGIIVASAIYTAHRERVRILRRVPPSSSASPPPSPRDEPE